MSASFADIVTSLENLNIAELWTISEIINDLAPPIKIRKARAQPDFRKETHRRIEHVLKMMMKDER